VARIAEDILETQSPSTLNEVNRILQYLTNSDPTKLTKKEGSHSFVECAEMADDFKYNGGFYQKDWHFINMPYFDEGGSEKDFPNFKPPAHNASEAISGIVAWFKKADGYKNSYIYQ